MPVHRKPHSAIIVMSMLLSLAAATALMREDGPPQPASSPLSARVSDLNPLNCDGSEPDPNGLVAFPGAQGFGRFARGGRGGRVYRVMTLADTGPGSLRECAEASGPRTCVFGVSGTIMVDDWIKVMHPYLTIAGQTSPGGIALRVGRSLNSPLLIQAHDVIVRHMRVRSGPSQIASDNIDTVQVSGGAHDVILDHLSTSWPTDEGINIVGSGEKAARCGETRNVTVQWSILSEGLNKSNRGPHSRGTYFGYGARNVSFHHNLIATNFRRNPLVNMRGQFDMINNVIYNSARYNAEFYTRFGALGINMIGNAAIMGPASDKTTQTYLANYFRDFPAPFDIYLRDNVDIHRPANIGDERLVLEPNDWKYVRAKPVGQLSLPSDAITGPAQAYRAIMAFAGAIRPKRDAVDQRVMREMAQCKGRIIDDPSQVGGWPTLSGPVAPVDRDQDGMADAWEQAHDLSPNDAADGNRLAPDGYTYLEKYLAELADDDRAQVSEAGGEPDPSCGFAITQAPPLPDIRLKAEPAQLDATGKVRLSWEGEHIRSCKLGGKAAAASGAMEVTPVKTTTYQINCIGASGGDAIDSATVKVSR